MRIPATHHPATTRWDSSAIVVMCEEKFGSTNRTISAAETTMPNSPVARAARLSSRRAILYVAAEV